MRMLLITKMSQIRFIATLFALVFLATAVALPLGAQDEDAPGSSLPPVKEVRSKLEQWVKTRQLITEENATWNAEKATLTHLNEVRLRESAQLDEFIAAAGTRVAEVDKQRAAFSKEETELKAWRAGMEKQVAALERKITPLLPRLPAPLRRKVEEAVIRLEEPDPELPLQNRARDLLLVLQSYLEFENTLTVDSDIREIDGARREVSILYMGMAQAWYVDVHGKYGGYGTPSDAGWIWTENNAIAPQVRAAIDIQTRRATPAFVTLPLAKGNAGRTPETK